MMPLQFGTVNEFVYSFYWKIHVVICNLTEGEQAILTLSVYNFSKPFCVEISDELVGHCPLDKADCGLIFE